LVQKRDTFDQNTGDGSMVDEEHKKIVGNLLPELESKEINQLLEYSEFRNKPPGNILINQGTKDQNLYLVLNGDLAIFQKIRLDYGQIVFRTGAFPGPAMVGEVNLLLQNERTATVLGVSEVNLYILFEERYKEMEANDPQLTIKLMRAAAKRMNGYSEDFRKRMYRGILDGADNHAQALQRFQKWFGAWKECPDALADKLFPDYEGENISFGKG
jgi:CRP-like cAMP-binding protein